MTTAQGHRICDEMSERIVSAAETIVTKEGTHKLTVRKILTRLGITNRVFYNRFRNIDEVLGVLYQQTVVKIRKRFAARTQGKADYFEYVTDLAVEALMLSYDTKMQFNHYMFENDSVNEANRAWWVQEIRKHIDEAIAKRYIKEVDSEALSYAIWCFCRGYNADAVGRRIPREKAEADFRYSFFFLLEGLKR